MIYINLTPHPISLNDGTVYHQSGIVARVESSFVELSNGIYKQKLGKPIGLPKATADTCYIVSAMVFAATRRKDIVAPATGHPEAVRNEKGQIISVPGFVVK